MAFHSNTTIISNSFNTGSSFGFGCVPKGHHHHGGMNFGYSAPIFMTPMVPMMPMYQPFGYQSSFMGMGCGSSNPFLFGTGVGLGAGLGYGLTEGIMGLFKKA